MQPVESPRFELISNSIAHQMRSTANYVIKPHPPARLRLDIKAPREVMKRFSAHDTVQFRGPSFL